MDDTDESVQVAQLIVGLAEHDSPDDQKNTSEGYSKQFRRIWKNLYIELVSNLGVVSGLVRPPVPEFRLFIFSLADHHALRLIDIEKCSHTKIPQ